jgi:hypothetical protein
MPPATTIHLLPERRASCPSITAFKSDPHIF